MWLLAFPYPVCADNTVLDNAYVRVTRDAVACVRASAPECNARGILARVIVALADLELTSLGARRHLARGDIAVFESEEAYEAANGGSFFEVSIKRDHPPGQSPGEIIAPEKNTIRYDGADFFVFEEKLAPGDTRARHSHSQRVVIQLNRARLQQWPDGEPPKFVETVPERPAFSPPVIHVVKNVGDAPLRGIVIEFKVD